MVRKLDLLGANKLVCCYKMPGTFLIFSLFSFNLKSLNLINRIPYRLRCVINLQDFVYCIKY